MQFFSNGPDLPERLLQAHEDGRVVFFCGAGISMPVFPDFAGLVGRLYSELGVTPSIGLKKVIKDGQYDIAVGRLERKIVGGRTEVRRTIARILKIPTKSKKDTVHEHLLTLSKKSCGW